MIRVKHGAKVYEVEVGDGATAEDVKAQIYSVTGVPVTRQKVLVRGRVLKDDSNVVDMMGMSVGVPWTVLGKAETAAEADGSAAPAVLAPPPQERVQFIEEMSSEELAKQPGTQPSGLINLGNTCYMNATLQTLRQIPELYDILDSEAIQDKSDSATVVDTRNSDDINLPIALRNAFRQMNSQEAAFDPFLFLAMLTIHHPPFSERDNNGRLLQHDAEECWTTILNSIKAKDVSKSGASGEHFQGLLEGQIETVETCRELPNELPIVKHEQFMKLDCHISIKTNHLREGILDSLTSSFEKREDKLDGKEVEYTSVSRISQLPKYLVVHLIRFYWRRDVNKKTKIMRKVTFPIDELDVSEFLTDDLRKETIPRRDKIIELRRDNADTSSIFSEGPTGLYELVSVMTHQGAFADAGHWIAWGKKDDSTWYKYNDDKVTEVPTDKISTLQGGGESDSAYLCVYKAKEK